MTTIPDPRQANLGAAVGDEQGLSDGPVLLFAERHFTRQALGKSIGSWKKIAASGRWVINSHPKSGTHLVRNLVLHLNAEAVHQEILFFDKFPAALSAGKNPAIYVTHLPFSTLSRAKIDLSDVRFVLLLRNPAAIALALARAFYDVNTTRADHLFLREHASFEEIVTDVICGYSCQGLHFAPLVETLREVAVEWQEQANFVLRFEEITAGMEAGDDALVAYFAPMLNAMFEAVPADAAARIRAAASPAISATYSRTTVSPYDKFGPGDVYALVPREAGQSLRQLAMLLGY